MKGDNVVFFDCETGGLECDKNPITQIAMICVNLHTFDIVDRYETFIKPYEGLIINPESLEKTMVTLNDLQQAADHKQVVKDIIQFAKMCCADKRGEQYHPIMIGHNVGFDIAFVSNLFKYSNKRLSDHFSSNNGVINTMDTMSLFRNIRPKANKINLTSCLEVAGLSIIDAHGAMNDTLATLKLFRWLRTQSSGGESNQKEDKAEKFRNTFQI